MKRIFACLLFIATISPVVAWGETYIPLTDAPGITEASLAAEEAGFAPFINAIYKMSIGVGAALAVLMIIMVGVQYAATDVAGTKVDLKAKLQMIIGGLILLMSAFVFLEYVNPDLVSFDVSGLGDKIEYNNDIILHNIIIDDSVDDGSGTENTDEDINTNN